MKFNGIATSIRFEPVQGTKRDKNGNLMTSTTVVVPMPTAGMVVINAASAYLLPLAVIPSSTDFFFVRRGTVEIQQLIPLAPPPPSSPPEPKLCTLIDTHAGTGLGPNFQWHCP
jgi:hypothetical protein